MLGPSTVAIGVPVALVCAGYAKVRQPHSSSVARAFRIALVEIFLLVVMLPMLFQLLF